MYNVEEFITECLDSLLIQTFQDFEVIIVDDCSTDGSLDIAKNYAEKFDGRLTIAQTEKNSGGASLPRNLGLQLANGEYIFFFDPDDFILDSALETLYNAAKKYNADVVYSGNHYEITKPNDFYLNRDGTSAKLFYEGLEDKTELTVDNPNKILRTLLTEKTEGNFRNVYTKLCSRKFLIENNIDFPLVRMGDDFIWVINVYCHAKRFLRISPPFYFYRAYNTQSIVNIKSASSYKRISRWISTFVTWSQHLKELENQTAVLKENPAYCLATSKSHFEWCLWRISEETAQLSYEEIYEILQREFSKRKDLSNSMAPFFVSFISAERKKHDDAIRELRDNIKELRELLNDFTARIDIKMLTTAGDFQILSMSDEKANVWQPAWLQKGGIGYQIQSYARKLEFVVKATVNGRINLELRGIDIRTPGDSSKRIPYWIDYTNLTVNGKTIFNKITPAWHDKAYRYRMDAKAGEEIKIQMEWLPHMENINEKFLTERAQEKSNLIPHIPVNPVIISVIIPMYNAEKYIAECLDSLLAQTFPYFEVIVVDDCSTDNSVKIVENYAPKFGGRLTLTSMEKNSGSAPAPRNRGFLFSRGEYIFFMDSDDTLTKTALQEMYSLAKEYNAEVVYCEKYYMSSGVGEEFIKNIHLADNRIQRPPFVDKPTFISDNLADRLEELFQKNFWVTPWQRLVSRKLLAEYNITFPEIIGSDDVVWCFQVLCCAKKFLRVPNACYVRRMYDESFTQSSKKSPNKHIHQWMDIAIRGLKFTDNFMSKFEFFLNNTAYRYKVLDTLVTPSFGVIDSVYKNLLPEEIYDIFLKEFSKDTRENNVLVAYLYAYVYKNREIKNQEAKIPREFRRYLTARLDIKLMSTAGDFKILSVSDNQAEVLTPDWFQKGGIGYLIQSYAGKLEFIAKATVNGRINLDLRGMYFPDPEDKSKRVPYWIDYTKLTVNGKTIFDKITPAWHDKTYPYRMDAKAGEEIKIQVEWLPHRGDVLPETPKPAEKTVAVTDKPLPHKSDVLSEKPKPAEKTATVADKPKPAEKTATVADKPKPAEKTATVADKPKPAEKTAPVADKPLPDFPKIQLKPLAGKFVPYLTGRIDIKLMTTAGDLKLLSVSDNQAEVVKPTWLQQGGTGYQIHSHAGQLEFVTKATVDGRVNLNLLGMDIRDSKDKSKRIPYWIDYTNLTINGKTIFDKITPTWHDKAYHHDIDVKAGEEIKVQIEWLPHNGDT